MICIYDILGLTVNKSGTSLCVTVKYHRNYFYGVISGCHVSALGPFWRGTI